MARGKFVIIDGMDGAGKGVILNVFLEEAKKQGKRVFDVHSFWNENGFHPSPNEIIETYDILITSEPTFVGIGKVIREELIVKNDRNYSPESVAEAYALDRRILYESLILPCLEAGISVFQSRSFATSIVYQRMMAQDLGKVYSFDDVLAIPGNAFCYAHPFNFVIIPTVDAKKVIDRLAKREKDDNCVFEELNFQERVKLVFESEEFKQIFTRVGTPVIYFDTSGKLEQTKEMAREFFEKNLADSE